MVGRAKVHLEGCPLHADGKLHRRKCMCTKLAKPVRAGSRRRKTAKPKVPETTEGLVGAGFTQKQLDKLTSGRRHGRKEEIEGGASAGAACHARMAAACAAPGRTRCSPRHRCGRLTRWPAGACLAGPACFQKVGVRFRRHDEDLPRAAAGTNVRAGRALTRATLGHGA